MNKHKHTPGPWNVEHPYNEDGVYVSAPDTSLVARVYRKQDAALVAAAPDLRAAVMGLLDYRCRRSGKYRKAAYRYAEDVLRIAEGEG